MSLSDYQRSMRPLCLDMLFTPVDYIFMIYLMKWLSWLVGVQSRACSSTCNYIIISMLSLCSEGCIELQAVTWALGLKKWLESWGRQHNTEKNSPQTLACLVMRASKSFWTLSDPQHGSVQRSSGLKPQWDPRASYLSGWDASWESYS